MHILKLGTLNAFIKPKKESLGGETNENTNKIYAKAFNS